MKEEKKREDTRERKGMSDKAQNEREKLTERNQFLVRSEEEFGEHETKARTDFEAADVCLNDTTLKLDDTLSSTPLGKKSVTVVKIMLDTAKTKFQHASDPLDKIRKKQKSQDRTTYKLLEKALPSKEVEK